ncbi:MAG: hypothetical protein AB4058_08645 [Microcystaceae cyanobacterium]
MIDQLIALILFFFIFFPQSVTASSKEEKLFQTKANFFINQLAKEKKVPRQGDFEKYVFPAALAHLEKSSNDEWAIQKILDFTNRDPNSFFSNRESFAAPGITRILYKYPNQQAEQQYLDFIFNPQLLQTNYNFWQVGGTENHVNMLRTSGYLLALKALDQNKPNAIEHQERLENWMINKAKATYQVGTAEWDSSTYTVYNVIGWLNIYDFAKDPKIKKIAQAMLDYYAAVMALKYSYGVYGGSEQRGGGGIQSFKTPTDYLGWLWFSEYIPNTESFVKWPSYLPTIHAATSTYRPPQEAIELARKQVNYPAYYNNLKAPYSLSRLDIPEFFYISDSYTLGSAIIASGEQIVNWKLVSFPQNNQQALVITGSNSFYKGQKNGVGKTKFDQYIQYQNMLLQMTSMPTEVRADFNRQQLRGVIHNILDKIRCGNSCQYVLQNKLNRLIAPSIYPVKKIEGEYQISNYISWPSNAEFVEQDNMYFIKANQTYLAIFPLSQNIVQGKNSKNKRNYLESRATLGQKTGFLIVAGNELEYGNFADFRAAILEQSQLDLTDLDQGIINYTTVSNQEIEFVSQSNQSLPQLIVDQQLIDFSDNNDMLYNGPNLTVKDRILSLKGKTSIYEVNYQGQIPIFKRSQLSNLSD